MNRSKLVKLVLAASLALGIATPVFGDDAPATTQPANPAANISAEAQKELDALAEAYSKLTSLEMSGSIEVDIDAAGRKQTQKKNFTSSFQSPNRYRHQTDDHMTVGSTGEKAYMYNQEKNSFYQADAAKDRADFTQQRGGMAEMLKEQNHALLLAMSEPATALLLDGASEVTKADDIQIDGKAYTALAITRKDDILRLAVDPQTHLLRQVQRDLTPMLRARNIPAVKTATVTYDFATVTPNAEAKPEQYAWTPPADARDVSAQVNRQLLIQSGQDPGQALVGKEAPGFTLEDLSGKKVSLADYKGKVVVLDFWATWCGPCIAGMPHLQKMYDARKEAGLIVFAVNQAEDKETIEAFLEKRDLKLPVLLDTDEKVANSYAVTGIPHQVVIGKDGKVKKVIRGFNPNQPDAMDKFVDEELKAK